jgi:hypothetical protein
MGVGIRGDPAPLRPAGDILAAIAQNEVLETHELAVEAERRDGIEEVAMRRPVRAAGAGAQPLVRPRQDVLGGRQRAGEPQPKKLGSPVRDGTNVGNVTIRNGKGP